MPNKSDHIKSRWTVAMQQRLMSTETRDVFHPTKALVFSFFVVAMRIRGGGGSMPPEFVMLSLCIHVHLTQQHDVTRVGDTVK